MDLATQKWTPAITEVNEKVLPMEEERKIEEVAAGKDAPSIEMEGGFVVWLTRRTTSRGTKDFRNVFVVHSFIHSFML